MIEAVSKVNRLLLVPTDSDVELADEFENDEGWEGYERRG